MYAQYVIYGYYVRAALMDRNCSDRLTMLPWWFEKSIAVCNGRRSLDQPQPPNADANTTYYLYRQVPRAWNL